MKYFQPMQIERFVHAIVNNDREVFKIFSAWEMEKDDIVKVLVEHFQDMGLFTVYALEHAEIVRDHIMHFLAHSQEIKKRREAIQREIAKAREKNRARGIG